MKEHVDYEALGTLKIFGIPVLEGLYSKTLLGRQLWNKRIHWFLKPFTKISWYMTWTSKDEFRDETGQVSNLEAIAKETFDFTTALRLLNAGMSVARVDWDISSSWLDKVDDLDQPFKLRFAILDKEVVTGDYHPSQADLLATDWFHVTNLVKSHLTKGE
jgi:hypothetical protein